MKHCFCYESLPEILKDFVDKKYYIEMQTEQDTYDITDLLNEYKIGYYNSYGNFEKIYENTLISSFSRNAKYVKFASDDCREGIMGTNYEPYETITVKEIIKSIENISINKLDDWETLI